MNKIEEYLKALVEMLGERYRCSYILKGSDDRTRLYIYDRETRSRYVRTWAPNEIQAILDGGKEEAELAYDFGIIVEQLGTGEFAVLESAPTYAYRVFYETYARKLDYRDFPIDECSYIYDERRTLHLYKDDTVVAFYTPEVLRYMEVVEI